MSHCVLSLVATRLLVFSVRHGGLEVDGLAAPGLVSIAAAICDLLLWHYSIDFWKYERQYTMIKMAVTINFLSPIPYPIQSTHLSECCGMQSPHWWSPGPRSRWSSGYSSQRKLSPLQWAQLSGVSGQTCYQPGNNGAEVVSQTLE